MSTNPKETTATTGFMRTRYQGNARDLDGQEAELKQMQDDFDQAREDIITDIDDGIGEIDQEEATFKKRYGDLRRYSNKQLNDMKKQIEELKEAVSKKPEAVIPDIPEDDEEYNEWVKTYPEAAKMISVVASRESKRATESLAAEVATLREREKQIARQKAELELTKLHPDWEQIRDEDDFHEWAQLEDQPKWVTQALYENSEDHRSVARVIDLYKLDKGRITPKQDPKRKPRADLDAADLSVKGTRHTDPKPSQSKTWKESDIRRMNVKDYQANEVEIMKAISEGKFVYDISS